MDGRTDNHGKTRLPGKRSPLVDLDGLRRLDDAERNAALSSPQRARLWRAEGSPLRWDME
ncbi:MAG: hypothetical protein WBF53_13960 [Litorimonas sp.]